MADNGWFKIHNALFKKVIWKNSTLEQQVILITLLSMANWKEEEWEWKGQKYICKPGEFVTSAKTIRQRCYGKVTRQNIRTALKRFETLGFLTIQSTKRNSKITIVNWDTYQSDKTKANQQTNKRLTISQPTPNHQLTTNKEYKTIKTIKTNTYEMAFEKVWTEYPNRKNQSKKNAYKAYLENIKNKVPIKVVLEAIEKQKKSKAWLKDGGQFIPHCSTWINGCMWESESDEDEVKNKKAERQQREAAERQKARDTFLQQHRGYILDAEPEALRKKCQRDIYLRDAVMELRPEVLTNE